ncbi:MAG: TonB-dependent receptor, partial [Caulobacteraceae bacterium]|nr:TonB-dependent receptor [Caulobacteraceae bacterium]
MGYPKTLRRRAALCLGSSLAALWAMSASLAHAETTVETIVVTAQKRSQNVQDVPGAISAIGGRQLREQGVQTLRDLSNQVPGVDFGQTSGGTMVTIRGVGVDVDVGIAEPSVAQYVDGVYLPRTTLDPMTLVNPLDLERVEVLRGPQGTLYGRNATGGAISLITQDPAGTFGGKVQASYGNYDTAEVNGMVTGPLSDRVRVRLSAGYMNRGVGYVDNIYAHTRYERAYQYNVRGALRADITDALTGDFSVAYERDMAQYGSYTLRQPGPLGPLFFPALATAVNPVGPYLSGANYLPDTYRSTLLARAQFAWAITPSISLKSITGYIDHKFDYGSDGDGTSADAISVVGRRAPSRTFSQEFNLGGALPNRGSWLVGAYLAREDYLFDFPVIFPTGSPGLRIPPGSIDTFVLTEQDITLAAFADATIGITDRLRVYGGGRLSRDRQRDSQTQGLIIPGVPASATLSCQDLQFRRDYDSFTPRIGVQYDVAPHVMVYAQYSKGFTPGGLNDGVCGNEYRPERIAAVEAGIKSQFFDNRAVLNASVFHYNYRDLQVLQIVGITADIANADARTWGAELEGSYQINDIFRVDASGTLLDAQFTKFLNTDSGDLAAGVQNL